MLRRFKVGTMVALLLLASLSINLDDVEAAKKVGKGLYIKDNVTIEIDGKKVKFQDPILNKDGSTLLPMRNFYQAIGATVSWSKKSLTASAERNGKTVDLTINSKTAKVNGKNVSLNTAAIMYKNRTYIPIRFASENLDGKVIWNQANQKVEITLNDNPAGEEQEPYILHLNNKRVLMTEPVIIRQNRTYISAKYLYQDFENTYGTWLNNNDFELQIAGLSFVFTKGSNQALVNQEPVKMIEKPFVHSGEMYVPVHFIVNTLGGNLRLISSKKEMYIYLYHYMFISDFIEKGHGSTKVPTLIPNARLEGNRQLLVSDNPETLTPSLVSGPVETLAHHEVSMATGTKEHRVFGWHLNRLEEKARMGITVQNHSTTSSLKITSSKGYARTSGNSWINYDVGLPMADLVLNGQLKNSNSNGMTINPGETKVIEEHLLHPNYTIGFLQDIDISVVNGGTADYTIRTVIAKDDTDLTTIHSDPVPIDRYAAHPRGVWPSSTIVGELPAYTVDSPEVGYNVSNGKTDHFLTEGSSLANTNGAVGNPGHFGMVYKVNIPIVNPTGEAKVIKVKLAGRGGLYSGAVKMNGQVHLVPTLKPGTEYIELPEHTITGTYDTITLELMHAGGASLPVGIYLTTK